MSQPFDPPPPPSNSTPPPPPSAPGGGSWPPGPPSAPPAPWMDVPATGEPGPSGSGHGARRTGWLIGGAIVVAALVGGGIVALTSGDDDQSSDDPPVLSGPGATAVDPPDLTAPQLTVPDFTIPDLTLPAPPGATVERAPAPAPDAPSGLPEPTQEPTGLGDDPTFDALAQTCYDGGLQACDDLFDQSDIGSAYETYGDTCAGRQPAGTNVYCVVAFGG